MKRVTGVNVRALRTSMGLSADDLASKVGVHRRTIRRWEARDYDPSPLAVSKLKELMQPDGADAPPTDMPKRRPLTEPEQP